MTYVWPSMKTALLLACFVVSACDLTVAAEAFAASPNKPKAGAAHSPALDTVRRYAEAIAKGDHITAGQLDFSCQYRFVSSSSKGLKAYPPASDPSYEACWQDLTAAHAPPLKRTDIGMEVLWPSTGPMVFYGDDLPRLPASAFVMDALGNSPPGSGLHVTVAKSHPIGNGSFPIRRN